MAVALNRVRPSGRFNQDIRPDEAGANMDGGDLLNADAHLVGTEPRPFVAHDRFVGHLDHGGENDITFGPTAGLECFGRHNLLTFHFWRESNYFALCKRALVDFPGTSGRMAILAPSRPSNRLSP